MQRYKQWFLDARKRHKLRREKPQVWFIEKEHLAYIQIPKVATRSIRAALFKAFSHEHSTSEFASFEENNSSHIATSEIRKFLDNKYFTFAFVRHPLARLCSAYLNKLKSKQNDQRNIFSCHGMYFDMPFEEFIEKVSEIEDTQIDRHLRSQSWFLTDSAGLLTDRVARLENFDQEWGALSKRFTALGGISFHKNKSLADGRLNLMFDRRTLRLASERYKRDLDLFGYEVDNF